MAVGQEILPDKKGRLVGFKKKKQNNKTTTNRTKTIFMAKATLNQIERYNGIVRGTDLLSGMA